MTVVCQISRGIAPAVSIAHAQGMAHVMGWEYHLVTGLPAAAAKNSAVQIARESSANLILCEDDFLAPPDVWDTLANPEEADAVYVTTCRTRSGKPNTRIVDGRILFSGTVLVRIPLLIIELLPRPLFVPGVFREYDGRMHRVNSDEKQGSDVHFFTLCNDNNIPIRDAGHIKHLKHPANYPNYNLSTPYTPEFF